MSGLEVISGNAQKVQMISICHAKRTWIVRTWHVRLVLPEADTRAF